MKRYKPLFEDAISDADARKYAEYIFKAIQRKLENPEHNLQELQDGTYLLSLDRVGNSHPELYILLTSQMEEYDNRKMDKSSTKVIGGFGHIKLNGRQYKVIVAPILLEKGNLKYVDTRWSGFKQTFIHEFVHYMDTNRDKSEFKKPETVEDYFNSAKEYNAYYQEATYALENLLRASEKNEEGHKKVLETFLPASFDKFVTMMFTKFFEKGVIDFKTFKTDRKLKKRLYGFYQMLLEKYRK